MSRLGDATRAHAPHGTLAAHRRHQRHGEPPCDACTKAIRVYHQELRARHGARTRRRLKPCGTPAAYQRHLRRGEVPCDACTAAVRRYVRSRIRARAQVQRRDPAREAARLERKAKRDQVEALTTHRLAIADVLEDRQIHAEGDLVALSGPTLLDGLLALGGV